MTPPKAETRRVQSAITTVSFPLTIGELRNMGKKWEGLIGQDWISDMDFLLSFPGPSNVSWIAPKWLP